MGWDFIAGLAMLLWFCSVVAAVIFAILRRWLALKITGLTNACLTIIMFVAVIFSPAPPGAVHTLAKKTSKPPAVATFPPYLELRAGQHAILDTNNEGDGSYGTLFDNMAAVQTWAAGKADPSTTPHHDLPTGTPVTVRSWTYVQAVGGDYYLMVNVATVKGTARAGYTPAINLLPAIPQGARLVAYGGFKGDSALMSPSQGSKTLIKVRAGTPLSLVSVSPNGGLHSYLATILSGPQRGRRGWFSFFSVAAPSAKIPRGTYNAKCRCVELFFEDLHAPEPTPEPTSVPMGPVTSEDKDYMNEACMLMHDGASYGFDFGDSNKDNADMRIVTCAGGRDLIYFRREHLAESKTRYANDQSAPGSPKGYPVPAPGTSDATPFPKR